MKLTLFFKSDKLVIRCSEKIQQQKSITSEILQIKILFKNSFNLFFCSFLLFGRFELTYLLAEEFYSFWKRYE